ncbi:Phosphoglycolate phosphatase, chromosomal [Roseivivax sp. THAF40]|uniref:phosphoglycolate phosphatase n=1 Tax=unclassified Roseivivax TaxID=2639302 RepID=UPI0012696A69|nr:MULTISPECIES: phosphoglycolate phosphatase [unclassified Roseivivax]QFS81736.1 Phosphoglycolate phosphatase, chromosomal [Roseivivax sp. THAF197b]QFT45536.1 Phosphoglycolate phosphatase, chromosomal [Roseivivax sp. THAF40]
MGARIVFDLDGTLVHSAPDIQAVANSVLAEEGATALSLSETIGCIGSGAAVFVERMRTLRGIADTEQARLLETFISRYESGVTLSTLFPGMLAALDALAGAGHRLGLCTNKPIAPTHALLRHFALQDRFESVLGGDSLPVRKPDPAPLRAVLDALGEGPALYVGDSEVDAETAERAGVPFLFFTEGYCHLPQDEITAAARFSEFAELPGLVARVLAAR